MKKQKIKVAIQLDKGWYQLTPFNTWVRNQPHPPIKSKTPLSVQEQYIAQKMKLTHRFCWQTSGGIPRSASQIRMILRHRKTHREYANILSCYTRMREGFTSLDDFRECANDLRRAEKFQGHLVSTYIQWEQKVKDKSEEEIQNLLR